MDIYLFNSLTHQKEKFIPIKKGEVSLYVCGPTVYHYVHIGNLRPVVVFDILRKVLMHLGYQVRYVSNFTDIDDKIIEQAIKHQTSEAHIAQTYMNAYLQDVQAIHALIPDKMPTVTEHMQSMITFIQALMDKGYAYATEGDVYFRVQKITGYGVLSHVDVDALQTGERDMIRGDKENPLDFALWKKTDKGISYDAPFGRGRPGWHTECVVMIQQSFKQPLIDIHGGGFDLKFPHHENEIAQSLAYQGTTLANYWLHNGFINIDDQKMSKSSGKMVLAKDFIAQYGGPLLRYVLLSTHYRAPVNLSESIILNAQNELDKIAAAYAQAALLLQLNDLSIIDETVLDLHDFLTALADDINTANALMHLHKHIKEVNALVRQKTPNFSRLLLLFFTIKKMLSILGLDLTFAIVNSDDKTLYKQYVAAKENKDFNKSDELRKILSDHHIIV
jgi:cysteinyl-tRNA synthetase